jgi:uncharacterized membrane protein (UPF0127 family)
LGQRGWFRWGLIIALLASALAYGAASAGQDCEETRVTIAGEWGRARFTVALADDPTERARGLMYVESLPMLGGMLFVYPEPQSVTFWMKNTLIPLDMLFVGPDGTILSIHENAIPHDETTISGGDGVLGVLEINGGMAGRLGISVGDRLEHPAFTAVCAG